ncbi:uncharacterized protein [Amphiura filiformis]|uniref:uncharacterized protein n=1 Tax=Amphiura filiformis TaxID=82378 RepID=UPI003B21A67F
MRLKERREEFQLTLKNRFTALDMEDMDIDSRSTLISSIVTEAAEEKEQRNKKPKKILRLRNQTDIPNVTVREVETAVKQMKDNKAPGTDDISSDVYKIGGAEIITQLTRLNNQILTEKKIPAAWKEAKIILLHKKGDKEDIKNYRPISLLSHAYKIFTRLIQNRIKIILDENQPREYVKILEDIHTNATATIHIDKDVSKPIHIHRGVRQGDTISLKIFTTAMEQH